MNKYVATCICIVFLLVIDVIWVTSNKPMYSTMVSMVQGASMKVNLYAGVVAYILMIMGLFFIVIPLMNNEVNKYQSMSYQGKLMLALRFGGLFGLIVYGIYNSTNLAIFKDYSVQTSLIDTLWGTFVYTITSYLYLELAANR